MEKDINELKRLFYSDGLTQYGKRKLINHYEQQIQELKEIEQIHRQENGELRERVKELEKWNEYYRKEMLSKEYIKLNYIPKSKIKKKIEELKQEGNYKTIENPNGRVHFQLEPCDYKIQVLEELLQEGE